MERGRAVARIDARSPGGEGKLSRMNGFESKRLLMEMFP